REQEGSGELVFDQKKGVMVKADLKLANMFSEDNITIKVPIEVHYRLLGEEELARLAEERKAADEKMAAERAKAEALAVQPLSDEEAQQIVAALKDVKTCRDAAGQLSRKKQADEHRDAIALALDPLLADRDGGVRDMATQALKVWATRENVPALV